MPPTPASTLKPCSVRNSPDPLGGVGLLEGQLGMGVDVERQRGELVAQPLHRVRDALLEGVHAATTIP